FKSEVRRTPTSTTVTGGVAVGDYRLGIDYRQSTSPTGSDWQFGAVAANGDSKAVLGIAQSTTGDRTRTAAIGRVATPRGNADFETQISTGPEGTTANTTVNATSGRYSLSGTLNFSDSSQGTNVLLAGGVARGPDRVVVAIKIEDSSNATTISIGGNGQYRDTKFGGAIALHDYTGGTTIVGNFDGRDGARSVTGKFVVADYIGGTRGSGGIAYSNGAGRAWSGGAAFVNDACGTGAHAYGGWVAPAQPNGPYGRFGSMSALQQAGQVEYQRLVDQGYDVAAGRFNPTTERRDMGNFIDAAARAGMTRWFADEGIVLGRNGPGVFVNSRLYNGDESKWRVPDVRIGDRIYDASLTSKSEKTRQVRDFYRFGSPSMVTIIRPTQEGGAYPIPRPNGL
ncbi:MAG: hypothetical protein ABL912_14250, partial [Novosphingobium sp.]